VSVRFEGMSLVGFKPCVFKAREVVKRAD